MRYFEKTALRVTPEDMENHFGTYLNDAQEGQVRTLAEKHYQDTFALRHPLLAGIPTLGIWPASALDKSRRIIEKKLALEHPELFNAIREKREQDRQDSIRESQHEHELALARGRNQAILSSTALATGAISGYLNNKYKKEETE